MASLPMDESHPIIQARPPRPVRVVVHTRPIPNHIVQFFDLYARFDYDPDLPFIDEFNRMCDYFHWKSNDPERLQARSQLNRAMELQFNDTFGTNANDIASWQKLCEIIQIHPIPTNIADCRRVRLLQVVLTSIALPDMCETISGRHNVPRQHL